MSPTPDELLKKLKPTPAFVVDADAIRALAELARELGPSEFVKRWEKATASKPARKPPATTEEKDAIAAAKEKATAFGKSRKLTSEETATALYAFASTRNKLPAVTKTAAKGAGSMVGWLSTKLSVERAVSLVDGFVDHHGPQTNLKHKLPSEG